MNGAISMPYKTMAKYPGMRPRDVAIWETFVIQNPKRFDRVWYDVHMGDPVSEDQIYEEVVSNGMYDVSRWCVDVIAEDEDAIYIIEVKPDAMAGALGQALAYSKLITKEIWFKKPLIPVVMTDSIGPITQQAADLMGVTLLTP